MTTSSPKAAEENPALPESMAGESILSAGQSFPFAAHFWFGDSSILDMDDFVKTLSSVKATDVKPNLIGSIITHYASKWLPDLSGELTEKSGNSCSPGTPESATAKMMKKRIFLETLIRILPPEEESVSCNFLLRLLRMANMVGVEVAFRAELEKRVGWLLDQATLEEIMIPNFGHEYGNLFDVKLVIRLVMSFLEANEAANKGGAALVKVAKLMDCYLAEVAVDANLELLEFEKLARLLPRYSRASDDGLYRAIDTYLKAHPNISKEERKKVCKLMDSTKLSLDACLHAAQNERLPVRTMMMCEQAKLNMQGDWSGSIRGHSKREMATAQSEIRRLREDMLELQGTCRALQGQVDRLSRGKEGVFRWKKLASFCLCFWPSEEEVETGSVLGDVESCKTPANVTHAKLKEGRTPLRWRNSL